MVASRKTKRFFILFSFLFLLTNRAPACVCRRFVVPEQPASRCQMQEIRRTFKKSSSSLYGISTLRSKFRNTYGVIYTCKQENQNVFHFLISFSLRSEKQSADVIRSITSAFCFFLPCQNAVQCAFPDIKPDFTAVNIPAKVHEPRPVFAPGRRQWARRPDFPAGATGIHPHQSPGV